MAFRDIIIYLIDAIFDDFVLILYFLLLLLLYIPSAYHEDDVLKWKYFKRSFSRTFITHKGSEPSHQRFGDFSLQLNFPELIFFDAMVVQWSIIKFIHVHM